MKGQQIIGVDVSKHTLDVCIKPTGETLQVTNDLAGIKLLRNKIGDTHNNLVVMEHTGSYSLILEKFLHQKRIGFCKVAALQIKRSLGIVRGKSDKIDACRIAEYGWRYRDELKPDPELNKDILDLRSLLSLRAKLVRDRAGYTARLKEAVATGECTVKSVVAKMQNDLIDRFSKKISELETLIRETISENQKIKQNFQLLNGIKGVGPIIAAYMIAYTQNFKKFSNARKFNCYVGIAPFAHQSGTSIRGRSRVSHLANKELKTLLDLGAKTAIQYNQELREYYKRRIAEGKKKMSCINIIRSKIVARMFAVIKRQSNYVESPLAA